MKRYNTKDIVLAALLTALSMLITFSPFRLPLPSPFSVTLASHVPTMVALFINPTVTLFTVIGSVLGFAVTAADPIIVPLRAATHIVFALVGRYCITHKLIKNDIANYIAVIILTSLLHAAAEAGVVALMTPIIAPEKMTSTILTVTFVGTLFHHYVDAIITVPIVISLRKGGLIRGIAKKEKAAA